MSLPRLDLRFARACIFLALLLTLAFRLLAAQSGASSAGE